MAFSHVGNRHSRAFPFSNKVDEVSGGGHRVLYEVDRGRAGSADYSPQGATLCVEEYSMPLSLKMVHSLQASSWASCVQRSG